METSGLIYIVETREQALVCTAPKLSHLRVVEGIILIVPREMTAPYEHSLLTIGDECTEGSQHI